MDKLGLYLALMIISNIIYPQHLSALKLLSHIFFIGEDVPNLMAFSYVVEVPRTVSANNIFTLCAAILSSHIGL